MVLMDARRLISNYDIVTSHFLSDITSDCVVAVAIEFVFHLTWVWQRPVQRSM